MIKYKLPAINEQVETVILAHGMFPSHAIPLSILNNCKYLVCCDGATNDLVKTGKVPDAIVGDCDSLTDEHLLIFGNIIHRIPEQETNDLTKAVRFCLQQGRKNITILGATGKRDDHSIANVSLLCEYMKDANVDMIIDYGVFRAIDKSSVFESHPKQQVSLFCLDKEPITSHHLVYGIKNTVFSNWWQATLNESDDYEFTIETTGRVIIYRAFS